ncbi:MAG TPA: FkbM family methyltransferase [Burkholderiaceae bacterium]|nr:FkbM family methyltransferase [Burkholderiaceae bacterium]
MIHRLVRYLRILGLPGLVAAVGGKLSGRPRTIAFDVPALSRPIFMRVPSSDVDVYEQVFLDTEYRFDVKQDPRVIIDAGANIGLASIYFANRFPAARIYAIECEASNFRLLERNAAQYPNIVPIHAALWDQDGEIEIVDPGLGEWGFMTATKNEGSRASALVRSMTMASVMREYRIDHVDILKIDIEGAELEVLTASAEWIDRVDTVIAELHDRLKAGCERSFASATTKFPRRWQRGENAYVSRLESCVIGGA